MSTTKEKNKKRAHLAELMDLLTEEEHLVYYPPNDVRVRRASDIQTEVQLKQALNSHHFVFDCSQTVEILCVVAGLNWPLAMRNGYTGTILRHLHNYHNPSIAMIGALVVFGDYPGHHVAMVRKPAQKNPILYSHGANMSSHMISLNLEQKFQPQPATFCSIAGML